MKDADKVLEYKKRYQSLRGGMESDGFTSHWNDIALYNAPSRGRFLTGVSSTKENDGKKKRNKILNSVPSYALSVASSGLMNGITPRSRPWVNVTIPDKDLLEWGPVKEYAHRLEIKTHEVFSRSNIYASLHHFYDEMLLFSNAAMSLLPSYEKVIRTRPFTIGEYAIKRDSNGEVDTFYRTIFMTARQIVYKFGDKENYEKAKNIPEAVKNAYRRTPDKLFEVANCIERNDNRLGQPDFLQRPYRSVYFLNHRGAGKQGEFLKIGYFARFPIPTACWKVIGNNDWGEEGPGEITLPDVKMLMEVKKEYLTILKKTATPPVSAPASMKNDIIDMRAGGVTFANAAQGQQSLNALYQVNPNLQGLDVEVQSLKQEIRTGYLNDMFLMVSNSVNGQKTATEIAEMHEEKLSMLGPMLESVQGTALPLIVGNTVAEIEEAGLIGPRPKELEGMEFQFEYTSIFAQAQKMVAASGNERLMATVGGTMQMFPEVRHKIDPMEYIDIMANALDASPKLVRSNEEVKQSIAAEQEAIKAKEQGEAMVQASQGARNLAGVDPNQLAETAKLLTGAI